MENNLYKKLFIISLVVIIILGYNFYSYKKESEIRISNNNIANLQISSQIMFSISNIMISENIDPNYLINQSSLFISLAGLNKEIPEYAKLIDPLNELTVKIWNNKIDKAELNRIGQALNVKSRDLLEISSTPTNRTLDDMFEQVKVKYNEIYGILSE